MPASIICSFRVIKQHRTCSKGSLHCIYFGLCEIHEAKCYIADSERDIIKCGGGGRKKRQEWGMRERKQEAVWKTCETLSVHTRIQKTSGKSFIKQPSWCHVERDQRGKINVNSVWTECTLYQRNRVMPAVGHGAYFIPGDDWVLRPDCANRYVGVCGPPADAANTQSEERGARHLRLQASYRQQMTALQDSARSRKDCRSSKDSAYFSVWPSMISANSFSFFRDSPRESQCSVSLARVACKNYVRLG